MCWNEYVSINTFIFGVFVLLLIAFNNKYSKYKIIDFYWQNSTSIKAIMKNKVLVTNR